MDSNLLKKLVVELSTIGAGSPDYVRNLITIISEDDTDAINKNPSQGTFCEMILQYFLHHQAGFY